MSRDIQLTTLDTGLRVITDRVDTVDSVALGVWAGVGARHETADVNGAAHMVEHMLFKGTQTRSAQDIVDTIEGVGGHMNAYTSREITSYHIHLLKEDASLALDVLADMYQRTTLPKDELEKERHVILQEIGMCNDTPDDLIFDLFYETAYADQAAGRSILGPAQGVKAMPRTALQAHIDGFYTAENTVICAAGHIDHDAFCDQVSSLFSELRPNAKASSSYEPAAYTGGELRSDKPDLEQAHILLGFEGVPRSDPDFYAARALSGILGGGMSSRLFQEIREKRGLVYSVFAFHQVMQDTGQFGIYAGTGPSDLPELMPALREALVDIRTGVTEAELTRIKTQIKAGLLMGQESMMSRADTVAKSLLHKGKIYAPERVVRDIEALTRADLVRVADRIFSSSPTLAALGPLSELPDFNAL